MSAFNNDFNRDVSMGSRQQDFVGDLVINLTNSSSMTLPNEHRVSSGG